jgi:hypothetical protein
VFKGSGLALGGLSLLASLKVNNDIFVYAPFSLSLVLLYVLLIIFYKFNSHNLQAGYCKLLNKEVWRPAVIAGSLSPSDSPSQASKYINEHLLTWEWCIELLRSCDLEPDRLDGLLQQLSNDIQTTDGGNKENIKKSVLERTAQFVQDERGRFLFQGHAYRRERPPCNKRARRGGFSLLLKAIFLMRVDSSSWQFPAWITAIFFLVDMMFVAIGLYSIAPALKVAHDDLALWSTVTFVLISHAWIWSFVFGKLHSLMVGDGTIDSYYWRFIPIRSYVLRCSGISLVRT